MEDNKSLNFIEEIIEKHLEEGKYDQIAVRFPPEPNGYLHIGHAASICLNFGLAKKYGGTVNLRFDDTNPVTEEVEYVESIQNDIKWLGFEWDNLYFTSDYFETLYNYAVDLIKKGYAYVDDSTAEEIAASKGDIGVPGKESPYRDRTVEENLTLFEAMRAGKYKDGEKVLRAKIDMAHPNLLMRDPIIYRIKHEAHHRSGNKWVIYPMYDFAHGQSDSIEHITHSICTLEFLHHRPLYEWLIEKLEIYPSKQYEFARKNLSYTIMSKRKLMQLVNEGHVSAWDDPRMPTISGLRRRGYTPASIRNFAETIGIAKRDNVVDVALLEHSIREDLDQIATRRMAVLDPIKLIITNYPADQTEVMTGVNNPKNKEAGQYEIPFSREVWIEREDFMVDPPKNYFRLAPGKMARLRSAYIVECTDYKMDDEGNIIEVYAQYFPESRSGQDQSGIKVKGIIHWVNVATSMEAEVRLYDRLFLVEDPSSEEGDFKDYVNPHSLDIIKNAKIEPGLQDAQVGNHFQFLRKGFFVVDEDSNSEKLVFNRTVTLKDSWSKQNK